MHLCEVSEPLNFASQLLQPDLTDFVNPNSFFFQKSFQLGMNFFKSLQELVLKRCKFPQYRLAKFSMTPYLQNTVKRLTLSECEIDNPHFEDFVTIFPNLEELEIYHRDYDEYNSFLIESLMKDLQKLCGLKNLRIVKIHNHYGADEDG